MPFVVSKEVVAPILLSILTTVTKSKEERSGVVTSTSGKSGLVTSLPGMVGSVTSAPPEGRRELINLLASSFIFLVCSSASSEDLPVKLAYNVASSCQRLRAISLVVVLSLAVLLPFMERLPAPL